MQEEEGAKVGMTCPPWNSHAACPLAPASRHPADHGPCPLPAAAFPTAAPPPPGAVYRCVPQIYRIQQILGPVTPSQHAMFSSNPHNSGIAFNIKQPMSLAARYVGKVSAVELDFMARLLEMDPNLRMTGEACLSHPYLADLSAAAQGVAAPAGPQLSMLLSAATAETAGERGGRGWEDGEEGEGEGGRGAGVAGVKSMSALAEAAGAGDGEGEEAEPSGMDEDGASSSWGAGVADGGEGEQEEGGGGSAGEGEVAEEEQAQPQMAAPPPADELASDDEMQHLAGVQPEQGERPGGLQEEEERPQAQA